MYFVAGLFVAGLVLMLILPAFWRRALRLSERRARLLTPLSVNEAIAERDQLRAEHAVDRRMLERRIEDLESQLALKRAELGREVKRAALDQEKLGLREEVGALRGELADKIRDARALEAELGANRMALHDLGVQLDRALAQVAAFRRAAIKAETRADEQRAAIAGLETRAAGLEARLEDEARAFKLKSDAFEAGRAWRAQAQERRADLAADDERSEPERDRALREAIAKLGGDVLRLFEGKDEEKGPPPMSAPAGPPIGEKVAALPPPEKKKDKAPALRRARTTSSAP
jgi:chromosome segregation ATPase